MIYIPPLLNCKDHGLPEDHRVRIPGVKATLAVCEADWLDSAPTNRLPFATLDCGHGVSIHRADQETAICRICPTGLALITAVAS